VKGGERQGEKKRKRKGIYNVSCIVKIKRSTKKREKVITHTYVFLIKMF
jgi:hypothetical protein